MNGVVVCSDDTRIPLGQHKHKCDCGTTWFHNMSEREAQMNLSGAEYNAMHDCPNCGNNVRQRYFHTSEEREACHEAIEAVQFDHIVEGLLNMLFSGESSHAGDFETNDS